MSAAITGTQPHQTNDKNRRSSESSSDGVKDGGPKPVTATPPDQELTPDRPPRSVDAAASSTAAPLPEASAGKEKRRRGFAAMDRTLVSEIARKGGKAAHSAGTAHEFTTEEAREAGRKGGRATHAKRTGASTAATAQPGSSPEREGAR
jgi:uncharacterized protein